MRELELIQLYFHLYDCYTDELCIYNQKFSPNRNPVNEKISDVEILTIYFYCRRYEDKHKKKSIYDFACRYIKSWFPKLPNYSNFNSRLNKLDSVILSLLSMFLEYIDNKAIVKNVCRNIVLIDSFPIITCSAKRSGKVAPELSAKSYCSTKNLYYFGVKMHVVAQKVLGSIPLIDFVSITPASENDLSAIRPILTKLRDKDIFADKAYADTNLNQQLMNDQNTCIHTPVKLVKGQTKEERQFNVASDNLFSTFVSKQRQPIESLFNWINEKTGLQNATKVRATKGLMIHIFGALAVALLHIIF